MHAIGCYGITSLSNAILFAVSYLVSQSAADVGSLAQGRLRARSSGIVPRVVNRAVFDASSHCRPFCTLNIISADLPCTVHQEECPTKYENWTKPEEESQPGRPLCC